MCKWVVHYVKTCQRVKPSGHASAPLQSLSVPADCWKSMSLDFVFGLPADGKGNTSILVFVCRLNKMVHLAPVRDKVIGKKAAQLFLESVFRYHGLPEIIVSDRDPRFTGAFWDTLFQLLETKLMMSTADHPQMDGQTERVNRLLEDTLRSIWTPQSPDPKMRVQKDMVGKEPRTQTRARAPPALLDRNGELHYHVERVVQERRRSGKRQLLVKWREYPSSQNSWEPEDRLRVDCPKAVEIWDQQLGRK
ncbi:Pol protein [Phytophthora palmivora]|uniref:Pol protein n=1 Tax=Phytophthora palmivora TaxID=4796 RepID=A0A2P4XW35_9STRA|nr:Pol protein [Phytophthora palmivora]